MFSKEESRQIRHEFWTSFGKSFPRKWILYNTKIKGLSFKFHFDTKKALITLDLDTDLDKRIEYWEKLNTLKSILVSEYLKEAIYVEEYYLENGKEISRIFVELNEKVSIHNKATWLKTMEFFNTNMSNFEAFFREYKDVIEA